MGAPCWSGPEREYFVKVILPMSKYAGGYYSKPEGMGWAALAGIMQDELDRLGLSRRRYTSDMLFQHYYQKCSTRSYKRGEGDKTVVPDPVDEPGNWIPPPPPSRVPPPPSRRRRPAAKKGSDSVTYVTKATQTEMSVAPDTDSDRMLHENPTYVGPLAVPHGSPITMSKLQPSLTPSRKRGYQASVEEWKADDVDFVLKEEDLEVPLWMKPAEVSRANGSSERMFPSDEAIAHASRLLATQSPDPKRVRTAEPQGQGVKSSGGRPQTPLDSIPRFDSPVSDFRSAGTSTIAYKPYTPTPSYEAPYSISDTSRSARPNVAKAHLEEQARPLSRASDRSVSNRGGFQAVPSSLRESSSYSNQESFELRGNSRQTRSPAFGGSSRTYRDEIGDEYARGSRRESSHFSYGEELKRSRFGRSPQREPYRFEGYRDFSEAPTTSRSYYGGSTPPRMLAPTYEDYEVHRYALSRPASPIGPARHQSSRFADEDPYSQEQPPIRGAGQPSGSTISPELRNGRSGSPVPTQRPTTPTCPTLSNFRIRKRSKQQPSISGEQDNRNPQAYALPKEHATPSVSNGLDIK